MEEKGTTKDILKISIIHTLEFSLFFLIGIFINLIIKKIAFKLNFKKWNIFTLIVFMVLLFIIIIFISSVIISSFKFSAGGFFVRMGIFSSQNFLFYDIISKIQLKIYKKQKSKKSKVKVSTK